MPDFKQKEEKKVPRKNPLLDKPFAYLEKQKKEALENKDIATAIKYLDAMIATCKNSEQTGFLTIELADLYMQQHDYTKAEKVYSDFVLLYPSAAQCDYAFCQEIKAGFQLTLSIDRDQTKTEEVLKRTLEFLASYAESSHHELVQTIATACRQKLFEHELYVYNYYFNNKCYKAAQQRLSAIHKEYIPHLPQEKPHFLEISVNLAYAQNNPHAALLAQLELAENFPAHDITKRIATDATSIRTQLALLENNASAHQSLTTTQQQLAIAAKPTTALTKV